MSGIDAEQKSALEAAVASDPGSAGFPALAEIHRREGRLDEALQVLRRGLAHKPEVPEGRIVLALVLLERGEANDARSELEQLTPDVLNAAGVAIPEADASLSDSELDEAFANAEPDAEQLITPNRVAEEALVRVDAGAEEGLDEGGLPEALEPGSAFATATMAELLAQQGDESGAERIRASLEAPAPTETDPASGAREQKIATLERWLAKIRGERA